MVSSTQRVAPGLHKVAAPTSNAKYRWAARRSIYFDVADSAPEIREQDMSWARKSNLLRRRQRWRGLLRALLPPKRRKLARL